MPGSTPHQPFRQRPGLERQFEHVKEKAYIDSTPLTMEMDRHFPFPFGMTSSMALTMGLGFAAMVPA